MIQSFSSKNFLAVKSHLQLKKKKSVLHNIKISEKQKKPKPDSDSFKQHP